MVRCWGRLDILDLGFIDHWKREIWICCLLFRGRRMISFCLFADPWGRSRGLGEFINSMRDSVYCGTVRWWWFLWILRGWWWRIVLFSFRRRWRGCWVRWCWLRGRWVDFIDVRRCWGRGCFWFIRSSVRCIFRRWHLWVSGRITLSYSICNLLLIWDDK